MAGSNVENRNYADFVRRLAERAFSERVPLSGSIELNERCNLECGHCYINRPAGDRACRSRELETDAWCRIIDELADSGCLWLLLTGGEPLLRPDFRDIYLHAKRRGLLVTVYTNGTTITPHMAMFFAEWPPVAIEISLYGYSKAVYEAVTGIPGSHARCLRGIEELLAHGVRVKLKTMVVPENRHELDAMREFAAVRGIDFRWDAEINTRVDGSSEPAAFRIRPDEIIRLERSEPGRMQSWHELAAFSPESPAASEYVYSCGAGLTSFHVDAYGMLSTCMMARNPAYDLARGSFNEGWNEVLWRARQQKWTEDIPCRTCSLNAICSACPGWSQMEHGDQQRRVEYLCEITHRRAEAMGIIEPAPKDKRHE